MEYQVEGHDCGQFWPANIYVYVCFSVLQFFYTVGSDPAGSPNTFTLINRYMFFSETESFAVDQRSSTLELWLASSGQRAVSRYYQSLPVPFIRF
jgi:hypothetical protein